MDQLTKRLHDCEDELSMSRKDGSKMQDELETCKEENRLGKILLKKEETVNTEGSSFVKKTQTTKAEDLASA